MKKLITFLLVFVTFTMINAQSFTVIESAVTGYDGEPNPVLLSTYPYGISSDGKYVTGFAGKLGHHMFTWTKDAGIQEWDAVNVNIDGQGSMGRAISTTGRVAGITPDPEHMVTIEVLNPDETIGEIEIPIISAAFSDMGSEAWKVFPFSKDALQAGLQYGYANKAYAISDDGNTVVGSLTRGSFSSKPIPVYWEIYNGNADWFPLDYNTAGSGACVTAVSGNGSIMGGWDSNAPVLWMYGDRVLVKGATSGGEVLGISNNGKYAALKVGNTAAYYDIANEILVMLENNGSDVSTALAVSDNGTVVGHWGDVQQGGYSTRKAFIYTEKRGMISLVDFFREVELEYPENFSFESITGISADGSKIVGYGKNGNNKAVGFYAEIPPVTGGYYPPRGISVENNAFGVIKINWIAAAQDPALTGYNIYHNGKLLYTAAPDVTSYIHNVTEDGEYSYYVKALYGSEESEATRTVKVLMAKRELPYYEPFSSCRAAGIGGTEIPLSTIYWDVTANTVEARESWKPGGSGHPAPCAFFMPPVSGNYEESLTTPYLDASGMEDLFLRFNYIIMGTSPGDSLAIYVYDGEEWFGVDTFSAVYTGETWLEKKYDISRAAGKNNVRIRFTCFGNAPGIDVNWNIDNVDIYDSENTFSADPPLVIGATKDTINNHIYVNWADPNGIVKLQYVYGDQWTAGMVGDEEEKSFIAANMYPAEDLKIYEGYKLTSLSFMPGKVTNAKYRWYVSQGGERLFSDDIEGDFIHEKYNTIILDEPIPIDVTKPLYYGVEAVSFAKGDMPFATSDVFKTYWDGKPGSLSVRISMDVADGRGNLWSDDGGETWQKLEPYWDEPFQITVYQLFNVRATLAKDPVAKPKERFMRYEILRNGVNILTETFEKEKTTSLTTFIDPNPILGEDACYEVRAFYATQELSPAKEICVRMDDPNIPDNIEEMEGNKENISIYPTSIAAGGTLNIVITDYENLQSENIQVYNMSGVLINDIKITGDITPVKMNVTSGVYTVKVANRAIKVIVE